MIELKTAAAHVGSCEEPSGSETGGMTFNNQIVVVQREWSGWQTATVRIHDLSGIHWHQPQHAPRPLVHAYVACSSILSGDIPHDCDSSAPPHDLLVCLLKCHMLPSVFAELSRRASEISGVVTDTSAIGNPTVGAATNGATARLSREGHGDRYHLRSF